MSEVEAFGRIELGEPRQARIYPVVELLSDGYSVPKGTHGVVMEQVRDVPDDAYVVQWLPSGGTRSVPVLGADLKQLGSLTVPMDDLRADEPKPEYEWQAVWMHPSAATGGDLRVEMPCVDEEEARKVAEYRISHPRCPSKEAWVERKLKVKQPPWERVE